MAKARFYKRLLLVSLLTAGFSVGGFSIANSFTNTSSTSHNSLHASSSNLQATANANSYLDSYDSDSNGNYNLNYPQQYCAIDTAGDSYAVITKSTNSTTAAFDQVTRYSLSGSNAGSAVWTIAASEFSAKVSNASLTLQSILYMDGGLSGNPLLYVLGQDGTNSYLFSVDWETGNTITLEQTFTGQIYNVMYVQSSVDESIMLFNGAAVQINGTTASTLNYKIYTKTSGSATGTAVSGTINLSATILSQYFSTTQSKLVDSFDTTNYYYFVYQLTSFTNASANNYATVFRIAKNDLSTNGKSISINSSNISSFSLTNTDTANQIFKDGTLVSVKAVKKDDSNFALFLSQQTTATTDTSEIEVATFSASSIATPSTFTVNTYDLPASSGRISSISPYYNNGTITGFLALDSAGQKIIMLDPNTLQPSASVYYTGTDICNVVTNSQYSTWFFQTKNGQISELSGNTLIFGNLTSSVGAQLNEFAASVTVKNESEISSSVLHKKVGTSATDVDSSFSSYLSSSNSYLDFLTVTNSDVRFGSPLITGTVTNITEDGNSGNYWVTIDFQQQLRQQSNTGAISNNGDKITIATAYFEFINGNASVTANTRNNVPASITSEKASDITDDDIRNYLVNTQNIGDDYTIIKTANDSEGTLNVQIVASNVWVNGNLVNSQTYNLSFGSANSPFFQVDLLNGLDGSVTGATSEYLDQHSDLQNQLNIKYGTMLPSQITASQVLDDFVILGDAFSNRVLLSQGVVVPPTADNVSLVPVDADGAIFVTVTIPRVGNQQNVVYSFETAPIFAKDVASNQNVYLAFKTNDEVRNYTPPVTAGTSNPYSSYNPSSLASLINTTDTQQQINNLKTFVNASNFVYNMLNETDSSGQKLLTVSAVADDADGYLTITFNFLNPLPGSSSNQLSQMYTGFATKGTVSGSVSSFSWGKISSDAFNGKNPTDITVNDLTNAGLFVYGGSASGLSKTITLTPLNNSGALIVSVTFNNWIQQGTTGLQTVPQKTFTTVIQNGLVSTNTTVNMIVWKSYDELLQSYKNLTASDAVANINNLSTDLDKLEAVANVSTELEKEITANSGSLELVLDANDAMGQLSATARVSLNGTVQTFTTTISGFSLVDPSYSVYLANTDSAAVNSLKSKLPSQVTDQDVGKLITMSTNNLTSKVTKNFNDIDGTLTVSVSILDNNGNIIASTSRTYSGFATNVPQYKGTDWVVVVLSVIIPAILLLIPILVIVFYYNRRDKIRFSKKLDKRLSEAAGKKKNKNVKHIRDLLNL